MALLLHLQRILTISLVLRTHPLQLLHHLCLALFSHHPHPRDRGEKEIQVFQIIRVILLEAAARVPCIKIMKVWIHLATLTLQSTMAAKKTIIFQKPGVLPSPTTASSTSLKKMGVKMIQMEIIQTVLHEETGGRVHSITNFAARIIYANSPPFGRGGYHSMRLGSIYLN